MNITPIDRSVLAACAFGASEDQIIRMLVGPQPEPVPLEMKMAALKSLSALVNEKLIVGHDGLWWLAGAAPKSSASSCLSEVEAVKLSKAVAHALGLESLSGFDASLVAQALSHDSLTGDELASVSGDNRDTRVSCKPERASLVTRQMREGAKPINESKFHRMVVQWGREGASFEAHCVWPRQPGEDFQADRTMLRQSLMRAGFPTEIISVMDMQRPDAQPATEDDLADVDFSKQPEPVPAPDDGSKATEELADQFFPTPPDVAALLVRPAPIDPSSLPKVLRESPLELVDVLDPDETALLDLAKNGRSDETVPTPAMDADFEAFLSQPVRARQGLKPDVTFSPQAHDSLDAIQQTAQKPTQITGEITTVFGRSGSAKAAVHIGPAPEPKPLGGHVGPALDPVPLANDVKPAAKPAAKSVREDTLDKLAPDIALLRDQGCDVDVDPPHPDKFFPTFSFRGPGERKTIQITHKDLKQRAARVRREMGT